MSTTLPKRVYVDTNIVSRLVDLRIDEETTRAFLALSDRTDIVLVTSEKTREEVLRSQDPKRKAALSLLVALFTKVPMEPIRHSGSIGAALSNGTSFDGSSIDPVFRELAEMFDPDDAEHLTHASRANCEYFLTLDERTILSRLASAPDNAIAALHGMRVVSPPALMGDLELSAAIVRATASAGAATLSRLARLDLEVIELWERKDYATPAESFAKLDLFEQEVNDLEASLKTASDLDRFFIGFQLRSLYWEYLDQARTAYASSPPYQRIKLRVIDGLKALRSLGG